MRKTKMSLAFPAARIRASKASPGGSEERSRNTARPSCLRDSSMRVAASVCSDEYERKTVLIVALLAREQRDQLLGFLGRLDELAAPTVRLAAVGEHQRPAVPH